MNFIWVRAHSITSLPGNEAWHQPLTPPLSITSYLVIKKNLEAIIHKTQPYAPALWEFGLGTTACNITRTDRALRLEAQRWNDVIASAVMALRSVSMPLNQAASVRWPTINEPFCSAWPLGRIAPGTWRFYLRRSLLALLPINTTNGVILYSEMDTCPPTPVSVCLVYSWTYFRKRDMASNLLGKWTA